MTQAGIITKHGEAIEIKETAGEILKRTRNPFKRFIKVTEVLELVDGNGNDITEEHTVHVDKRDISQIVER